MTTIRAALALACAALLSAPQPVPAQALAPEQVAARAVSGYFQPGYGQFLAEARAFERSLRDLCAAPDPQRLSPVRPGFAALIEAWSRIELVRFGPVLRDNQLERVLFWPDRRGIGLRQVQAILASKDESAADPASLHAKSVAVQGLGALEYALLGSDLDKLAIGADPFRCRFASAIAGNVARVAGNLHAQWSAADGIAAQFTHPAPGNPAYHTKEEVLSEIVGVLAHGFEAIRDTRLKPMLGETPRDAKPKAALYWRSGLTVASLRANVAGLRALFEQSHIADALPSDAASTANSIRFEFANVERALRAVTLPIEQAAADADQHGKLAYAVIVSQSLQKLVGQDLAAALGLSVGFSSADGD
jgi:predicted lipoprotein